MANEITFDKLPQAVGYLTEQVERIHKIVAALQPQTSTDKHRIVEIDEACKITRKAKPTIYTLATQGCEIRRLCMYMAFGYTDISSYICGYKHNII